MKILLVSDSHGNRDLLIKLANIYRDYTKIHLGDRGFDKSLLDNLGFIYIDGNCDYGNNKDKVISIDDQTIFITHGDKYNIKFDLNKLYFKALEVSANIVFFGHTHIQTNIIYDNIRFINPGALINNNYCIIEDNDIKFYK